MDDFAMLYEAIVRRAHGNCGRYGSAGADADIYRHLQEAYALDINGNPVHKPFEKGEAIGRVKAFLYDAIENLQAIYPQHRDALQEKYNQLIHVETCDEIDIILTDIQDILGPV